jgi:hypothetical protein
MFAVLVLYHNIFYTTEEAHAALKRSLYEQLVHSRKTVDILCFGHLIFPICYPCVWSPRASLRVQDINRTFRFRYKDLSNRASLAPGKSTIMSPAMAAFGIILRMLFTTAMHRSDE